MALSDSAGSGVVGAAGSAAVGRGSGGLVAGLNNKLAKQRKQLDELNYRLPPSVGALVDRPSAEAFLDFWWANPNALVLLTRRPALEWAKSRAKFGQAMNLPVDRPCRLSFADASTEELAQLLELHDELVRCCVVQP